MLIEIISALLIGILAGTFTGLAPGIHINLIGASVVSLSASSLFFSSINPVFLVVFIVAMSITHTFTDFISSTYLGAPSDDTAMAVLPAHKMLLDGMAHEAVKLTVIGSLLCLILTIALSPLLIFAVPIIFSSLKDYVGWILLAVVIFMILREENHIKRLWSFAVVALSGTLGLIVFGIRQIFDCSWCI